MQMRQEQQKHQYLMSANSGYYMPGSSLNQYQQGYGQPMFGNPQFHPQMMQQGTNDGSISMQGQPQISQANMPLGANQIATMSQSMGHLTNTYAMSPSNPVGQSQNAQSAINQANVRPQMGQQIPLQQQMMMQQMHQTRMSLPAGLHQMPPQQNISNGISLGIPQQNGQNAQIPKQTMPSLPQQPNYMPPMTVAQQNMGQAFMNPSNPMMGMQIQNMRMPLMQGNPTTVNQQVPPSSYSMSVPNQSAPHGYHIQQPQISIPNQPTLMSNQMMQAQSMPGHTQGVSMPTQMPPQSQNPANQGSQAPHTQSQPMQQPGHQTQMTHTQQINIPGQMISGQQMMMPGQQLPQGQNVPQMGQQVMSQGQQIPQGHMQGQIQQMIAGQQMGHMQTGQIPQQLPQAPQMQGQGQQQMTGSQQIAGPGQQMQMQMSQVPPNAPGQPIKMPQANFNNVPQDQQQNANSQPQQSQAPPKPEHNNNTAELISFD